MLTANSTHSPLTKVNSISHPARKQQMCKRNATRQLSARTEVIPTPKFFPTKYSLPIPIVSLAKWRSMLAEARRELIQTRLARLHKSIGTENKTTLPPSIFRTA